MQRKEPDEPSEKPEQHPPIAGLITSYDDLKEGDILLFRPSKAWPLLQNWIKLCQSVLHIKHGHYDTTHVAVYAGKDIDGDHTMAHITEKGFEIQKMKDYLKEYECGGDDSSRSFNVYRSRDSKWRGKFWEMSVRDENKKCTSWGILKGAKAVLSPSRLDPNRDISLVSKEVPKSAICSLWVIHNMKLTSITLAIEHNKSIDSISPEIREQYSPRLLRKHTQPDKHYPHIRSSSTPKRLESFVYVSEEFERHIYPGTEHLYQEVRDQAEIAVKNLINNLLKKLKYDQINYSEIERIERLSKETINTANHLQREEGQINDLERSLYLLKVILPVLEQHAPEERSVLIDFIRSQKAIFYRDIMHLNLANYKRGPEALYEGVIARAEPAKNTIQELLRRTDTLLAAHRSPRPTPRRHDSDNSEKRDHVTHGV